MNNDELGLGSAKKELAHSDNPASSAPIDRNFFMRRQLELLTTIKNCLVYFVVLSIIGIAVSIIALVQ
jgi:hypothetical protein